MQNVHTSPLTGSASSVKARHLISNTRSVSSVYPTSFHISFCSRHFFCFCTRRKWQHRMNRSTSGVAGLRIPFSAHRSHKYSSPDLQIAEGESQCSAHTLQLQPGSKCVRVLHCQKFGSFLLELYSSNYEGIVYMHNVRMYSAFSPVSQGQVSIPLLRTMVTCSIIFLFYI